MIDLHLHSSMGSFLDGFGTPTQIVERAVLLGRKAIAITDHDHSIAHPYLEKVAVEKGIKSMLGCEIRIVKNIQKSKESKDSHKYHLTLLAGNQEGYRNLLSLITSAWDEGFYYLPSIDYAMLKDKSQGIIALSGCLSGELASLVLEDKIQEAIALAKAYKNLFGGNYYLEIMPFPRDDTRKVAYYLRAASRKLGIPIVLTNDVHFLEPGQEDIWRMLHCIKYRKTWQEMVQEFTPIKEAYQMRDDEAWQTTLENLGDIFPENELYEMFSNQEKIASDCNVTIPKARMISYNTPGEMKGEYIRNQCEEKLKERGLGSNQMYIDRMNRELDLVTRKGFIDYFLVSADFINWAKSHNILVGPGRGSSSGSLVCWLLGITEIDPIAHNLIFERFIAEDRKDLPDIDTDFQDSGRPLVLKYISKRFGEDKVALLGTFAEFKGRNSLDEVGKMFQIPKTDVETIKNLLVNRSIADSRATFTIEDTLNTFDAAKRIVEKHPDIRKATLLEGQFRHMSVHAAGVVLADAPLINYTSIINKESGRIASFDGDGAKYLGLLKMDILGLKTLSVIKDTIDIMGVSIQKLYEAPLNNKKVFAEFNKADTVGVFQFEAEATRSIIRDTGAKSFQDLVICNALSRPGPLHSGATRDFVDLAKKGEGVKVWGDPLLDEITGWTKGAIIFQEQVMEICRQIGKMSYMDVSAIRECMSKSLGAEFFNRYKEIFVKGAVEYGLKKDSAGEIWDSLVTYGCLVGDTKVRCSGGIYSLSDLYGKWKRTKVDQRAEQFPFSAFSLSPDGNGIIGNNILDVTYSGVNPVYRMWTDCREITATEDHVFLTPNGWRKLGELVQGDCICISGDIIISARDTSGRCSVEWSMILGIQYIGARETYDIAMKSPNNSFIANNIVVHNSWAFNQAHSTAYSVLAYWTMLLKVFYPHQYYWAMCCHEDSEYRLKQLLRDYIDKGLGNILPPKVGKSQYNFALEGNDLRIGLSSVKGIGDAAAKQIISLYPILDREDLEKRSQRRVINSRVLDTIDKAKLLDGSVIYDPFSLYEFASRMSAVEKRTHRIGDLFYSFEEREITVAGVIHEQINLKSSREIAESTGRGKIPEGLDEPWCVFRLEDETGTINVHTRPNIYPRYKNLIWSRKIGEDIVIVRGIMPPGGGYVIARSVEAHEDRKALKAKCWECPLKDNSFVPGVGPENAGIVLVGECPGYHEVEKGEPFVGRAGQKLDEILQEIGLSRENLYITNSVLCRPVDAGGSNRSPEDSEVDKCQERLLEEIRRIHPRVVVALGATAYQSLTGDRESTVSSMDGMEIQKEGWIVIFTYHPANLLYGGGEIHKENIKRTLVRAKEIIG